MRPRGNGEIAILNFGRVLVRVLRVVRKRKTKAMIRWVVGIFLTCLYIMFVYKNIPVSRNISGEWSERRTREIGYVTTFYNLESLRSLQCRRTHNFPPTWTTISRRNDKGNRVFCERCVGNTHACTYIHGWFIRFVLLLGRMAAQLVRVTSDWRVKSTLQAVEKN